MSLSIALLRLNILILLIYNVYSTLRMRGINRTHARSDPLFIGSSLREKEMDSYSSFFAYDFLFSFESDRDVVHRVCARIANLIEKNDPEC